MQSTTLAIGKEITGSAAPLDALQHAAGANSGMHFIEALIYNMEPGELRDAAARMWDELQAA